MQAGEHHFDTYELKIGEFEMKQNTKEWLQYGSAIAMLASAIVLAFLNFLLERYIHSSVLMYVGEAIAFTGAVYGLAIYTRNEVEKLGTEIRRELRHGDKGASKV